MKTRTIGFLPAVSLALFLSLLCAGSYAQPATEGGPIPLVPLQEDSAGEEAALEAIPPTPTPVPLTFEEKLNRDRFAYAKIKGVIASNHFLLENGVEVRLLGIQVPAGPWANEGTPSLLEEALEFSRRMLQNRPVKVVVEQPPVASQEVLPVFLFLPSGRMVNQETLREGYGAFDPQVPIFEPVAMELMRAQLLAERRQLGMWKFPQAEGRLLGKVFIESALATEAATPTEATRPSLVKLPPVEVPPPLPNVLILKTGVRLEGTVKGDPKADTVVFETADGSTIALPQNRIAEIEHR